MTVIHPNSISGIASVTSQSNSLYFYESDHSTKLTINAHVAGNVTGDITATNGTFSGDVTIGGKLTYDDVTNIDSVGIITARSDVSIADKIIHTGDTNTAIRFPAADTVTVETSGSERLRIASDGKVGVGEDSPEALLHVGSADSWIDIGQQSGNRTKIGFNNNIAYYGNSSSAGQHVWKVNNTRAGSPWGSGNEVMRITTAGNIGIGTAAPTDHLQILHTNGKGLTFKTTENHYAQITADCSRTGADDFLLALEGKWNGTPVAEIALTTGDDAANKDDGKILFKTSASSGNIVQRMEINRLGQLLINSGDSTFNSRSGFFNDNGGSSTAVQIEGSIYAYSSMSITRNGTGASGATFIMAKGQGGTTIINNNDTMGQISFQGAEGTGDMVEGAKIIAEVDGSPASNNMPGRMAFYTNSGTSTSTERLRITSAGDLFVAGTGGMNTTQLPNGSTVNINGTSSNDGFSITRYSSGYGAYGLNIARSKSDTIGTNTLVTNGNDLGHITFYGANGSTFLKASMITAQVDGTAGTGNDMPGRLVFKTTPDGSADPVERLRIDSSGRVTTPFQPLAIIGTTINNHTPSTGLIIEFNYADTNRGNHYNTSNYTFTCPVNGDYMVMLYISRDGWTGDLELLKNGTAIKRLELRETGRDSGGNSDWQAWEWSFIVPCSANDSLKWKVAATYTDTSSSHSGYLLDGYNHVRYDSATYYLIG